MRALFRKESVSGGGVLENASVWKFEAC